IRTLLLTFFYRQMRPLIETGHVYVARPPLFKVSQKKNVRYVSTLEEMSKELMDRGIDGTKLTVQPPEPPPDQPAATPAPPATLFQDDRLRDLVSVLGELEEALQILERRGFNIAYLLTQLRNGH